MGEKDNRGFKASDLVANKQYRAIIILVFYFFLFLVLIMSVRNSTSKEKANTEENKEPTEVISKIKGFSSIKQANFHYKYTLHIDNNNYIYEGKKYNKNDSYTLTVGPTQKTYTTIDEFTFENKNNENILVDKPYYYIDFFNPEILEKILIKAVNKENNIYTINNTNLDRLLGNKIGVDDKSENNILLQYTNDTVTRIDIDYSNYVKYNGAKVNKVFLTLEYSDFGIIEEFNIKN